MKHTRIIQLSVALTAAVVGSACSTTTTPDAAINGIAADAPEGESTGASIVPTADVVQPVDVAVATTAATTTVRPTTSVASTAPDAAPAPRPTPETDPTPAADPTPAPEPGPEVVPPTEPGPEPTGDSDPDPVEPPAAGPIVPAAPLLTRVKVEPMLPSPLPRPDFGLAFAPCGAFGPIADTASAITSVTVDAVGDGTADDALVSYRDGGDWALRLTTSGGTISEYDVSAVGPGYVEALGAVQLDGAPGDQFLAVVGSGASNLRLGAFGADEKGCIVRFASPGGTDVEFMVGGTIGQLNGLACSSWNGAGHIETLGATDMGGGIYNVYGTTFHKTGVDVLEAEGGTHLFGLTFDEAEAAVQFDCGAITL